jgi:putative hydrolase of the HAD superfamily
VGGEAVISDEIMIKNIIFDVYGTLISTGSGSVEATRRILNHKGLTLNPNDVYRVWKIYHREHMEALTEFVTEKEIFIKDLARIYEEYGIMGEAEKDVEPMLESLYGRCVFEDTLKVIADFKKKYRIAIGSTTDSLPLKENMALNGLEIEAVYTSESLQVYKPRGEFYKQILQRQGWKAAESLYVGDSYLEDVVGPKAIGMKAVLIDRKNRYVNENWLIAPDAVIKTLYELEDQVLEL